MQNPNSSKAKGKCPQGSALGESPSSESASRRAAQESCARTEHSPPPGNLPYSGC